MVLVVAELGFRPALDDDGDKFLGRQIGRLLNDGMDVVSMPSTGFPDHKYRQLTPVSLVGIAKQAGIQQITKVLEVGFRGCVINPLSLNNLLLSQGDIDRAWNLMVLIKLLDDALDQDKPLYIVWGIYLIFICSLSVLAD